MNCAVCEGTIGVTMHRFWFVKDDEIPASSQELLKMYQHQVSLCDACVARRAERWRRLAPKAAAITTASVFALVALVLPFLILKSTPNASLGEVVGSIVLLGTFAGTAMGGAVLLGLKIRGAPKRAAIDLVWDHRERFGLTGCSGFWQGERPSMVTLNGRNWRVLG